MIDLTIKEEQKLQELLESLFDLSNESDLSPEITSIYLKLTKTRKTNDYFLFKHS
jgi:hypothetical protein